VTWWNRATSRRGLGRNPGPPRLNPSLHLSVPALLLLPVLAGCVAAPPVVSPQLLSPSGRNPQAGTGSRPSASVPTGAGLTSLPSARAVVGSVPVGRSDPFLPVRLAPARGAAIGAVAVQRPSGPPENFRFQGVLRSGGVAQALVQFGTDSGAVRVGDRGGRSTELLPQGWSVAAIDVERGRLVLRQGQQTIRVEL
jgi:hypothetical protein